MPYAVLSADGEVEIVESSLRKAVEAAESEGALDVIIDTAPTTGRRQNPEPAGGKGALKQLRLPGGPQLRIPPSAIDMPLKDAWQRIKARTEPFTQTGRTGIVRQFYPAEKSATLVKSMLGQNAKTEKKKGHAENVDVQGLNLTPYWMFANEGDPLDVVLHSKKRLPNMCAGSTEACRHSCLVFAGQNYAADWSIYAKFLKTRMLFEDPEAFGRLLLEACARHLKNAPKHGFLPAVRLNVLSDVPWELVFPELFATLPQLQFYDYTKVPGRQPPRNYDLTFSNAGGNLKQVQRYLGQGGRVAVVAHVPSWRSGPPVKKRPGESAESFAERKDEAAQALWVDKLPKSCDVGGRRYEIIDGDRNDVRFLDDAPTIVALRWKSPGGQAAARAAGALQVSQKTKFVTEIEDFCGLWVGAVTPSEQPDTLEQTVYNLAPLEANPKKATRRWGTARAGYTDSRIQRAANVLIRGS